MPARSNCGLLFLTLFTDEEPSGRDYNRVRMAVYAHGKQRFVVESTMRLGVEACAELAIDSFRQGVVMALSLQTVSWIPVDYRHISIPCQDVAMMDRITRPFTESQAFAALEREGFLDLSQFADDNEDLEMPEAFSPGYLVVRPKEYELPLQAICRSHATQFPGEWLQATLYWHDRLVRDFPYMHCNFTGSRDTAWVAEGFIRGFEAALTMVDPPEWLCLVETHTSADARDHEQPLFNAPAYRAVVESRGSSKPIGTTHGWPSRYITVTEVDCV